MARIVVAGGGMCGMAAAMMLARDGHDVVVLEHDKAPVPAGPDEAWWSWERRSVAQFRLAHLLLPGGYGIVARDLPEVATRLEDAGGYRWNPVAQILPAIPGSAPRDDDDRFASITARRPALEWAFAATLADEPGVEVRRGSVIDGFVAGPEVIAGVPHVVGVRLSGGDEVHGDLVVDATGRRSATCEWLAAIGARPPEETSEDLGFTYTGRFWRSPTVRCRRPSARADAVWVDLTPHDPVRQRDLVDDDLHRLRRQGHAPRHAIPTCSSACGASSRITPTGSTASRSATSCR